MKIVIIADTHFGCRKNSSYFMEQQRKFYDDYFFPYLKEKNIDTIIHLGDFFDNRKTINFETLRHSKDCFINPIAKSGITLHMIVGNHDSYYKSNGELTSTKLLFDDIPSINVYDTLTNMNFDGKSFLMVPWIFPIQKEEMTNTVNTSPANVCCGHFEMMGVVFQGNTVSRKGIDTDNFTQFDHVFSGHFHKKSQYYVGCPYQMKWSDYEDPKRIIVYDTATGEAEDVYLYEDIYHVLDYPRDTEKSLVDYDGKIVRVVVKSKDDLNEFDNFIERLESVNPQEIDIKEEYLYMDVLDDDEVDDNTDTLGILLSSVDNIDELNDGDKVVIKEIMKQLYNKAGEE